MPAIHPEGFIRAWQQSQTVAEVARKTGLDTHTASNKAAYLRRLGVPMKALTRTCEGRKKDRRWMRLDVPYLTKFATEYA